MCVPHESPFDDSYTRSGDTECGAGATITIPIGGVNSFISGGGAATASIDVSESTLAVPFNHQIEVKLLNAGGGAIATQAFAATNYNDLIKAVSPASVDAFLNAYGENASKVEIILEPFATYQSPGDNEAVARVINQGSIQGSIGALWYASCGETYNPETGAPNVCTAEP